MVTCILELDGHKLKNTLTDMTCFSV